MKKSTENFTEHQKPAIESTLEDLVNTDGLEYAHYVLQNRALVEVFGDGLKPVQRRILYGMYKMGSTPSSKTIKGARIAGEVIGKYHPHGNCIHGDERFMLQTGEIKTIRELYELTQKDPNITFEGYSIKGDGQLVPSIISNVRIGQYTNEEYNIHLSNGDVIRVTDEHPIRLFNGDFIKARDLKSNDLLSMYKDVINSHNDSILVKRIEVKKVNNQPMYDFTVNGYENALFKTSDDTLVCLHNSSVEAAQEIMGQHFNTRIPMFKIQGTLGEFTGSAAPAARYYELGLNKNSWELVKELSQHATTYRVTEMGDDTEPLFLPARFPYSICNGSAGIAVGYASNMPPHNPDEVIDTCIAFYKNKIKKSDDVLKYMQGPDFPTGGEILGIDGIKEYFNTGSGSFTIRGKYKIEDLTRGRKLINFYELPYQVSVAKIIESVYKLQERNQLKEISEVKDLSDSKRGLSCAIYVKSGSNVNKVIDDLFKSTPLQSKFSANMTALYKGVPKPNISMYEMIEGFCVFRQDCFIKRTSHRLEQIEAELLKYNGLLKVLVDIDKAISIIRNAKNAEEANSKLQKTFKINEEQASYILAMKLRQLTKADKNEILAKADEVKKEDEKLKKILSDEKLIHKEIIKELEETKSIISNPRRTSILGVTNEELKEMAKKSAKQERLLEKDVDCYIHTIGDKIYKDLEQGKDYLFKTSSKSDVYLITEDADVVKVKMDSIPLNKENAISINSLNTVSSKAISIVDSSDDSLGVFISSKLGDVNIIKPPLKDGNKLAQLVPGDTINCVYSIKDEDDLSKSSIAFISVDGKIMKIKLDKIRITRQGAGLVKGHSMEAECVSAFVVNNDNLIVTETKSEIKYTLPEDCPDKGRGGKGYQIHRMKKGESVLEAYKEDEYITQKITPRGGGGVKKK